MEYTLQDLVAEWKMRRGLEPLRTDAAIHRQDAFDVDEYVRRIIDGWYERLLADAPVDLLDESDITEQVTVSDAGCGTALMQLPAGCVRITGIQMAGWERPAVIVEPDSKTARRQVSPFGRGGSCCPVAVKERGNCLRLYSFPPGSEMRPERVTGVMRPPQGIYRCSPLALESLLNFNYGKHGKQ